jgi:hypothetical protein
MADGKYVVPLVSPGRVQLYDPQWHFLRGWHVDAEGGDFKVRCSLDGLIEVLTARGNHHYIFNELGELISATTVSDSKIFVFAEQWAVRRSSDPSTAVVSF